MSNQGIDTEAQPFFDGRNTDLLKAPYDAAEAIPPSPTRFWEKPKPVLTQQVEIDYDSIAS